VTNFILIFLCFAAGILLRRYARLPTDGYKAINAWLIWLALPAVSFKYLPNIQLSSNLLLPAIAPVIVWCGGWLFSHLYSRANKLDKPTSGSMKLSTGLSNTSFIGFPLVAAYFGDAQIGIAIICDQVTFLLLATAAIIVGIHSSASHELSAGTVIKKIFSFPALPACIAALTLPRFIDLTPVNPLFDKLASTVAPLALFSIGLQLNLTGWRKELEHITAALIYKLLIAPALVLIVALFLHANGMEARIAVFEAAMATLVSSAIVAGEYNMNPKLSGLVISIGIILSFITTALWYGVIVYLL
jgi:malate permease and related proteins